MGLGTKIKSALHGDSHSSSHGRTGSGSSYEDGRVPGSFPSEGVNNTTSTTKPSTTTSNGLNSTTKTSSDLNTHNSTLKKSPQHNKTDSGVDFVDGPGHTKDVHNTTNLTGSDYQRPVSREGGIGALDDHTSSSRKNDPYWGNIKQSGYERDLPHRPVNQVERDLNTIEKGTYGSGHSTTRDGMVHDNVRSTNAGPHSSNMMNKADPRVDSDLDNRGVHGAAYNGTTGNGLNNHNGINSHGANSRGSMLDGTTATQGLGSTNQGPHNSNMLNKADPRVDSDIDHRATTGYGSSMTGSGAHMTGNGHGRDMHGTNLTTHGGNNADISASGRRSDLHNVGLAHPDEPVLGEHHDDRLRARDNGYSPVNGGVGLGSKPHHASLAERHHQDDLRDAGLYNDHQRGSNNHHNGNNMMGGAGGMADGNNVMYGRSASTRNSPQRSNFGHGVGGSPQQHTGSDSHFVPRVVHTCNSCGADNDISRYFRSDVSYRLG